MDESLSLNQGRYHKSRKFQTESFTNITDTVATANIPTVPNVSTDPDIQEAFDLQAKMEDLLNRLQQAETDQASFTDKFVNSTDSSKNKYLNNNVHFSNENRYGYVTNQSELKMYDASNDNYIYKANKGKHGCPDNQSIEISIPFPSQPKLGQSIELEPGIFVVLGLPITQVGESCGFEGRNVYVDKLITNTTAAYQGCYADKSDASWYTSTTMSFIGGSPPVKENDPSITAGNFYSPTLGYGNWKNITGTEVYGWTFGGGGAVLMNDGTAWGDWGYIYPYPGGRQIVSLENRGYIYQLVRYFIPGTYTLSLWYAKRPATVANTINIYCTSTNIENVDTTTETPIDIIKVEDTVNKWTLRNVNITIDTKGNYNIGFYGMGLINEVEGVLFSGASTAITNISLVRNTFVASGTYTYDMCKQEAINNGYQYFALQDVDKGTKKGYCAVSGSIFRPTSFGESKIPESAIPIWRSDTTDPNNKGKYAKLTSTGSLAVYNSADAVIFITPIPENQTSGYIGCYGDQGDRAMPNISNNKYIEFEDCHQLAIDNKLKYFALQDVKQARDENNNEVGIGWCAGSNDLGQSTKYGIAGNCAPMSSTNKNIGGRAWSNAIYNTTPDSPCFLILQDDSNMVIYNGYRMYSKESLWGSYQDTENHVNEYKLQDPNPDKTAAKGKFGRNYITNEPDQILYPGDFIGSSDGSIFVIMQDDGNLVLYTTKLVTNCSIIDSIEYQDIYGGGVGANALYKLDEVAIPANMGKNGYVNGESKLSEFPADMMTTGYSEPIPNKMGKGIQMIPGYGWTNGSTGDAKWLCDNEPKCNTIVTFTGRPGQYLIAKNPTTELMRQPGFTSILKTNTVDKTKINSSCNSQDPISIDTIQWEHYQKGALMTPDTTCSITKLETLQNKTMDDLKIQLAEVSSQLVEKLNKIEVKNNSLNTQMDAGRNQIRIDVKKYKENAQKILSYSKMPNKKRPITQQNNTNTLEGYENAFVDNIVSDSNIVSTQSIYSYIIWSVIATVTVIITIELFTNERNTSLWKLVFLSVIIVIINGLFREYALLVNILIVIMFIVRKKFKLMAKENNNI